jgi:hypothetical protein
MALERVGAKVPAYDRYARSGDYRKTAWWRPGVEVAVVVATPERRVAPLSDLSSRLGVDLKPLIIGHRELLQSPWKFIGPSTSKVT